jgi:hypothetical protein
MDYEQALTYTKRDGRLAPLSQPADQQHEEDRCVHDEGEDCQ